MRRMLMWYFLQNKRLFKKYSFILILCLVPILIGAIRLGTREESGMLKIALCVSDPQDELATGIVREIKESDALVQYLDCPTEEKAIELLRSYEVDAAWIFPSTLREDLENNAHQKVVNPVVRVLEREDTIMLTMSREILCKSIYPYFSYASYVDFVRNDIGLEEVSDAELQEAYNRTMVEGSLFRMEYLDGQKEETTTNYLLAPLRGILAIWLVLCGFAASMYYIQDEKEGIFSRIPIRQRFVLSFVLHGVLLTDAIIVLLIACKLSGVFTSLHAELLSAILFAGCTLVFCNLLRMICKTLERLGCCIPIILSGMLVLCPVFLNVHKFKAIQYLLPPYYYLKSIHSTYYLYGMVIYILVVGTLCILIHYRQNKDN